MIPMLCGVCLGVIKVIHELYLNKISAILVFVINCSCVSF